MSQFISPGVYVLERDLSQYVSDLSSTIVAMVGTADKGPTNVPTLITSAAELTATFGNLNPNHYLGYAALSYLKQGTILYVTRVAAPDAMKANLTVPVPATYTPYTGDWVLSSQTASAATFTISNPAGAVAAGQFVALQDAAYTLPGFDFQDTTGIAPIKSKLGSDLLSFITAGAVSKYVKGRTFKITSGVGKDSSVVITDLVGTGPSLALTVNTSKFNTFNSPLLATATGSVTVTPIIDPGFTAATADDLFKVGSTSTGGSVIMRYVGVAAPDAATTLAALNVLGTTTATLESLISVVGTDVIISTPLYYTSTAITASDAALNATLFSTILTKLIELFRSATPLTGNIALAAAICRATSNGITGIGNINLITGLSEGIKSAEVLTDGVTVKLSAITLGATGNYNPDMTATHVVTTPIQISGAFTTNLYRPTWVVSTAGTSTIPTLFKFSSVGEGDFSNLALKVGLNSTSTDTAGNLLYTVDLYGRLVSTTVSNTSILQSDFTLIEHFEGTPESLQSTINGSSNYLHLKIDYSTEDVINPITGIPTYGTVPDYLTTSFGLFADLSGLGATAGEVASVTGTIISPAYSDFLQGGSLGTTITKYDILGDASLKTGIYSFSDPEQLDINLLLAPGWSADPSVAKGMVGLCEKRGDAMAILDTPYGLSVQNVKDYKNNVLNINSNYAAIYYPWVKITDTVNKKDIFVPPSGLIAGQYAYNDLVGEVFTAPAGRNRGNLTDALATERILNQGDRDILTLAHINPIHFEAGYGIYIRGQMTMQSASSALDRVNVRRLLLNLRKVIATASKSLEFEPGDAITALRLKQLAESTLEDRLRKGAIRSYTVDVGPNVNTATTLENNELRMSISLVPTKTAEKIIEVFNILGQGQGISLGA
jgi:phage tail sheath protein FI